MPYNKQLHANLGHVDKPYKEALDRLLESTKYTRKAYLELLIEREAKKAKITLTK